MLMLSQIQPHFLYNTLSVIADLCHGAALETEAATIEFAEYLRGKLDSIKAEKPIAFAKELQHAKTYLALEKRRFDERLKVQWDIRDTLFRTPALTLQPIGENAVKYGVTKRIQGGTIWISSWETEESHVISVRDNGVGFDGNTQSENGRSHIGIKNERDRLSTMSGGTLEIESIPGEGTTATITIPKEEGGE